MANLVAMKFGGTSMGSAESISACAEIVLSCEEQPVVVVSAMSGVTDMLIGLGERALAGENFREELAALVKRHEDTCAGLGVTVGLSDLFSELSDLLSGVAMIKELSLSARDRLIGMGERLSSRILAAVLAHRGVKSEAFCAYDFIYTDDNFSEGNVDFERSDEAIKNVIGGFVSGGGVPVITGFVAQAESGKFITLGRGGSDYTCAIVGAALDAKEVQIWTDVDGILSADPRLIEGAEILPQLSFNEAGELAYFGAKVLHPKTIKPAIEKNIAVRVLNTFNPSAVGTVITSEEVMTVKSVTYKKGISIINVCSAGMLEARGFMAKLFEVFARHEVSVDVVATSEVSVSMTVEGEVSEELLADLGEFSSVSVSREKAIVCLVGEGIKHDGAVLGRLFSGLSDFDVSMVSQGASKRNITFLVDENAAPEVVKSVYNSFFN